MTTLSQKARDNHTPKPQKTGSRKTSSLVGAIKTKDARTANDAVTHSTTLNNCLDLFFLAGASRNMDQEDIHKVFSKAYNEDQHKALKILFWARDVRQGAGERRFFRECVKYLNDKEKGVVKAIVPYVSEYGRWDDLFEVDAQIAVDVIKEALKEENPLLCKWLPREKSSKSDIAKLLMKELGLSPKEYRQKIAQGCSTVEDRMSAKEWGKIEYNKIPSMAFHKYRKAFERNDESRFTDFVAIAKNIDKDDPEAKDYKVNAGAIYPQNIYDAWRRNDNKDSIIAQWNNLPDHCNDESILPVCDVSGSMMGQPMSVSVSLGVYLSQRNKGIFQDVFMTFSGEPQLEQLNGDVCDRFMQLERANWEMNTDLNKVFLLILDRCLKYNVPEDEQPDKVLIISDMEFDSARSAGFYSRDAIQTNHEAIEQQYRKFGVKMPQIVYWNVNGRPGNVPVQKDDTRTALVSGFSPSILKAVLGGDDLSPMGVLNKTIETDRYAFIDKVVK